MSTQDSSGIEFCIVPEEHRQHFRLLELPAELLGLITSEQPPALEFKSLETIPGRPSDPSAVICTPDKTYNVRQVNTSNSVYVLRPTDADGHAAGGYGTSQLHAVAESNFTLELSEAKGASAAPYLKDVLPLYSSTGTYQSKQLLTKHEVYANIPVSNAECEQAWVDLACFELADPAGCFLPSATAKVEAWRSMVEQASAMGIDMTTSTTNELAGTVVGSDEEWPVELAMAVLSSVSSNGSLDEPKCARRIGLDYLEAQALSNRSVSKADLLKAWADALPEKWRSAVDLDLVKDQCVVDVEGRITLANSAASDSNSPATAAPADAKSSLGAKRKWHDKFRASKKTA